MGMQKRVAETAAAAGRGKYRIVAEAKILGRDISVTIWGGTRPHIGSIVLSTPRPSLKDSEKMSATSSLLNVPGHKDELVARMFAEEIASRLNTLTVVSAGIHIEKADGRDLSKLMQNAKRLCCLLTSKIENELCKEKK